MNNSQIIIPPDPKPGLPVVLDIVLLFIPPVGTAIGVYCFIKRLAAMFKRSQLREYRRYAGFLTGRNSVSLEELARRTGHSIEQVTADIQQMIDNGYITGNPILDRSGNLLILSTMPFSAHNRVHVEPQPEPAHKETVAKPVHRTEKTDEYEKTIREIQRLNDAIENRAVSERIDRIKALSTGIFSVLRKSPEREAEVRKFMNYYLPTTIKLLESYSLMEKQTYRGENIQSSMEKIESILDTLIDAFEQMHNNLFQSSAMDVDADIRVLETMMASDGLSEKGNLRRKPAHG